MNKNYIDVILISFFLTFFPASFSLASSRVALVIGNGTYSTAPLENPTNDAQDMASTLRKLGFEVIEKRNADKRQMIAAIDEFADYLENAEIGLFYYAGHGMQIRGQNYLIPVEVTVNSESDVEFEAVNAARVLGKMRQANTKLNVVILDACRNNPFKRSFRTAEQGLARMDAPIGTIIAYSTSPGSVAADGIGRNGLYTEHLLKVIQTPGLNIQDIFNEAGMMVMRATQQQQVPWTSNTPIPRYSLVTGDKEFVDRQIEQERGISITSREAEEELWQTVEESGLLVDYRFFLEQYPQSSHVAVARLRISHLTGAESVGENNSKNSFIADLPKTYTESTTGMEFVLVPGGCYIREKSGAKVCLDDYYLGKYEVTVGQWRKFVEEAGFSTEAERNVGKKGCWLYGGKAWAKSYDWEKPNYRITMSQPVTCTSYNDVTTFINWLNNKGEKKFNLPSEAQWEYAAKGELELSKQIDSFASQSCKYSNFADISFRKEYGWPQNAFCDDRYVHPAPIGSFMPNSKNIHDMFGNVSEWVKDWYDKDYYSRSLTNPIGPSTGTHRVFRGGDYGKSCGQNLLGRSTALPWHRYNSLGFRLVMLKDYH